MSRAGSYGPITQVAQVYNWPKYEKYAKVMYDFTFDWYNKAITDINGRNVRKIFEVLV